jgi:hypothetical protein
MEVDVMTLHTLNRINTKSGCYLKEGLIDSCFNPE